jgi:hypothetical protein
MRFLVGEIVEYMVWVMYRTEAKIPRGAVAKDRWKR